MCRGRPWQCAFELVLGVGAVDRSVWSREQVVVEMHCTATTALSCALFKVREQQKGWMKLSPRAKSAERIQVQIALSLHPYSENPSVRRYLILQHNMKLIHYIGVNVFVLGNIFSSDKTPSPACILRDPLDVLCCGPKP